jgi:hypothetical protein
MAELSKRGVVAAVICSGPFLTLGRNQARVFGVPELPLVVIPHPLGGVDLDGVRARAAVATETVVKLIKAHSQ